MKYSKCNKLNIQYIQIYTFMSEQIYKLRNNESNLLKKLKFDKTNTQQQFNVEINDKNQKKKQFKYQKKNKYETGEEQISYQSQKNSQITMQDQFIQNPIQNPVRSKKKNNKKQKIQKVEEKEINLDAEVGEAAQWMEKGTKNIDQNFQSDQNNINPLNKSISQKMAQKANKLAAGTFKAKTSNAGSLKQKAEMLRRKRESEQQLNKGKQQKKQQKKQLPRVIPNSANEDQDPWQKINKQTMESKKQQIKKKTNYTQIEIVENYMSMDLSLEIKLIKMQIDQEIQQKTCFMKLKQLFLSKNQINQKIKFQLLALTKIQIKSDTDQFLLQAIWNHLTQKKYIRFGTHWQLIGFQGRDPETDLRGSGILSLFQIYLFINKHGKYFKQIHQISCDEQYNFPFAISCIKITGKFIKLLKSDKIYGKSLEQYNNWYNSIFYYIFESIRNKKLEVMQFGLIVTQKLQKIDNQIQKILKNYKENTTNIS